MGDFNTARNTSGCGTRTASLAAGGETPSLTADSEEWNGTAWTEGSNLNAAEFAAAGCGIQTDALMAGGQSDSDGTESYNGSSWTVEANLGTGRYSGGAAAGTSAGSVALFYGGRPPTSGVNNTEDYDGVSWTEVANLAATRWQLVGAGSRSLALCVGGSTSPSATTTATEEWTMAQTIKVLTD